MNKYEYILLDDFDRDVSAEEIQEEIEGKAWCSFEADRLDLRFAVEEILKENHLEWGVCEEDDGVCLAVKEEGSENFEVYWVYPYYRFYANSHFMFDKNDIEALKESAV
ncbi:hypothetical protein BKK51_10500 [Rodentibacter trehalosifermentans]|uniref:Uncharacterized protein n=2 Tax=Rodentibacter trehalosifermentans TaxID=1908263 RepID=A0A1V3IPH9_9PAST|nr:hypothetical protein BKK51_10500 [Rodentibacter trehalosifermentans]